MPVREHTVPFAGDLEALKRAPALRPIEAVVRVLYLLEQLTRTIPLFLEQEMLMHADNRRIDHLHGRVMRSSQRIHNPAPHARPTPGTKRL